MATNDYHFITHWRVESTVDEVTKIIGDPLSLVHWWPSVYLHAEVLEPGDEHGLGRVVSLHTKGWLPYTLRWQSRVTEIQQNSFTLVASGDFDGRGIWTFEQDGPWVNITYDWKIKAEKPLLRNFSFIMKPIFSANHRWAMAKGEESLKLEIARRHTTSIDALARIPAPPQPTSRLPLPLLAGAAAVFAMAAGMFYVVGRFFSRK
jgi:hypothetical protein